MGFRVDVLHIQQQDVRYLHQLFELAEERFLPGKGLAGSVDAGADAPGFGLPEQVQQEIHLEQRFPSADGDAPFRTPVGPVAFRLVQQFVSGFQLAPLAAFPGVHIVAVQASHVAALDKDDETGSGPVHGPEGFDGMDTSLDHNTS